MPRPQMLVLSFRTQPVAMVFADSHWFTRQLAGLDEGEPLRRVATAMVQYAQGIIRGEIPGPFSNAEAERRGLLAFYSEAGALRPPAQPSRGRSPRGPRVGHRRRRPRRRR